MMMILKGHGGYLTGRPMEMYGMQEAPSPSEIPEGECPWHYYYDDATGEIRKLDSKDGFDLYNTYQAIVEASVRSLVKQAPALKHDIERLKAIKKRCRELLNESAKEFNIDGRRVTIDENSGAVIGETDDAFPHVVYHNTDDPTSVDPRLRQGGYTPRYHKKSMKRNADGSWHPGSKGDRWSPESFPVKRVDGVIPEFNSSNADHQQSGHMSESGHSAIVPHYVHNLINDIQIKQLAGVETPEVPSQLSDGHVAASAYSSWTDPESNESYAAYTHYRQTNPPDSGRHKVSHRDSFHGPHYLIDTLASLHPALFMPIAQTRESSEQHERREKWAANLLLHGDMRRLKELDPGMVRDFANSAAVRILYASTHCQTGTKGAVKSLFGLMHQAMRIPIDEPEAHINPEAHKKWEEANHNTLHMGVQPSWLEDGRKLYSKNMSGMNAALFLSMQMQANPELARAVETEIKHKHTEDVFNTGIQLQSVFNRNWGRADVQPISAASINWVPQEGIPKPNPRFTPRKEAPEWLSTDANQMGSGGRGQEYRSGLLSMRSMEQGRKEVSEDDVQTSFDRLNDIMDSLQSADARMDDIVLKSLPAKRRFNISDTMDCNILCANYNIEVRDLHYIHNGTGDWTRLADDLKVDTAIVKGVKIALRW